MNIYKVERTDDIGWDEYISAVVVAKDQEQAIQVSPISEYTDLKVTLVGKAAENYKDAIVIDFSLNAG